MKNVTPFIICKLLLNIALCYTMLLFSSRNLYAKPCQDLFISEILFGIEMPHMPGVINHAIEIYNPTDGNISLSGYSIIFTTVNGISVPINLNGVILAKSTFVISNSQAFLPIISVSGQFSPYLDFQNVTVISLIKNGLGILDKIGNEGPGIPLDEIDIDQLQNPEYLENININLGSLKNLDVRRDELVQEGKPVFEVGKILSDWAIYTSLEFENLGFHQSACAQPVIFFQDADLTYPEQYYPEGSASVTWTVRITEPLPVDIEISIDPLAVGHQFIVPDVPGATFAEDYKLSPSIFDVLTWVTSTEFTNYEIVEIIYQDDLIEGEEGAGVWLSVIDDNGTGTTVSTTKRVFDFVIFDPLMSAENTQPANFKLFPTIVTTNTSEIQWIAEDFSEITSVKIIGISGKIMLEENCNGRTSVTLPGLPGKGLYYVQFFTAKGSFTKKILKI